MSHWAGRSSVKMFLCFIRKTSSPLTLVLEHLEGTSTTVAGMVAVLLSPVFPQTQVMRKSWSVTNVLTS